MAYTEQTFTVGQVLTAAEMNNIDDALKDGAFLSDNQTFTGNNTFSGTVTVTGSVARVEGTSPQVVLDETDATATHNETWLLRAGDQFRIQTRDSSGSIVANDYLVVQGASGATQHNFNIEGSLAARIDSNSNLLIGTTTAGTDASSLDILDALGRTITITNTASDATNKIAAVSLRHYTNSEEGLYLIGGQSTSGANSVRIGGSLTSLNAATQVSVFTAANNTTTTGTEQVRFTHTGNAFAQDLGIGIGVGDTPGARLHVKDSVAGDIGLIESTEAGANPANFTLYRNSTSPAVNDNLFDLEFAGEDSGGNKEIYAAVRGFIIDPTDGSEDGQLRIITPVGGTTAVRFNFGGGMYSRAATGGDPGDGGINAKTYQLDGTDLKQKMAGFWINFDGTGTISTRDSFNVTSITDNGTGDYTVTIDSDFDNANWSPNAISQDSQTRVDTQAAGSIDVFTSTSNGTADDSAIVSVSGFGDH